MNWMIAFAVLLCAALGAGLLVLVRRIGSMHTNLPVTADWIDELTLDRYHPMKRLLEAEDVPLVGTRPGRAEQAGQQRIQRCRVFCQYLHGLQVDYRRVTTAIRVLMVQSRHDRPDLARLLIRQEALFAMRMIFIHARLLLYRWGYGGVDATGLVQTFDSQRTILRTLLPATARG